MFFLLEQVKKDNFFRRKLYLRFSIYFNGAYSVFLGIIGGIYDSKWFLVMSAYYGLLSVVRIFLFVKIKAQKTLRSPIKTLRTSGYFLLILNLVISVMMFILLRGNHKTSHHEITVITLATYTFTTLTVSIITSIKHLKQADYVYTCIKLINLVSSSVSLVTLTNTMLATFGEDNQRLRSIILPMLSGAVTVLIITCAIFMIKKANSNKES